MEHKTVVKAFPSNKSFLLVLLERVNYNFIIIGASFVVYNDSDDGIAARANLGRANS